MKFAVVLGLIATTSAYRLRYDQSEGPTKADNGEADETILSTKNLGGDQKAIKEWENPLEWRDDGTGDDKVLLQTDGTMMVLRKIYDVDGDGVEDNVEKTREELDRFEIPAVFGPAEEMHNTHHGNLPGHVRAEEEETEPTYFDPYSPSDFEGFADLTIHV